MKRKYESQVTSHKPQGKGSALILAVVLTTLLAVIGVVFLLVARIDKMAASAASENRELALAVETVIAKISQQLALDVPRIAGQEYYDYPDVNNVWLAALEPYKSGSDYYWPQISDVYSKLVSNLQLQAAIVPDYQDAKIMGEGQIADADGDGVADSRWVVIPDVNSSKGKPVYAAIRIIDNGGMLNVNTAYRFNPNETDPNLIDGSSQLQINLMALAGRPPLPSWPGIPYTSQEEKLLLSERDKYGIGASLDDYKNFVIWSYSELTKAYTPFDISDELELRYRFLLNHEGIDTRLEEWGGEFRNKTVLSTPVTSGGLELNKWFKRSHFDPSILDMTDPKDPNYYAYRHIAATCNMDRIIDPNGAKMVNVNTASAKELYSALYSGLKDGILKGIIDPNLPAQLAVNIVDLRDNDANVTVLPKGSGTYYYGFEAQPFISEIAYRIDGNRPDISTNNYFVIELCNPFEVSIPLGDFRLELRQSIGGVPNTVNLAGYMIAAKSWFVITNGPAASKVFNVTGLMSSTPPRGKQDPNLVLATYVPTGAEPPKPAYALDRTYDDIYLLRKTSVQDIYLDREPPISGEFITFDFIKNKRQFYYRPDGGANNNWNIIYPKNLMWTSSGTLGAANGGEGEKYNHNYNIPTFRRFVTVGDIARVLTIGPSTDPNSMIGMQLSAQPSENSIRIKLADSRFQQIFNYLTVFDPNNYGWPASETRVKGRININTAPWFVIAQLPWMQSSIAQTIVAYRDTNAKGFKSIGELMNVAGMDYYKTSQTGDLTGFPDLTFSDGAADDLEERDVIFSRISNLVTVRSDVFTAYILVRIGPNGPQRRVIAILDRCQVTSPTGKVKIIALQPVPDPR